MKSSILYSSSASAQQEYGSWYGKPSQDAESSSDSYSQQSSWKDCSAFLCTCLLLLSWRHFWRAGFAATCLTIAALNLATEISMHNISVTAGTPTEVLAKLRRAAAMFPIDHNLRRMPAALAIKVPLPFDAVESTLMEALKNDPHSSDLQGQLDRVKKAKRQ